MAEVGAYSMVEAACPAGAYDALLMNASHPGVVSWPDLRKGLSSGYGTLAVEGAAGETILASSFDCIWGRGIIQRECS